MTSLTLARIEPLEPRSLFSSSLATSSPDLSPLLSPPALQAVSAPRLTDLSPTLEQLRSQADAVGIVAGAIQNGSLVAIGSAGLRKAGTQTKLRTSDSLLLGSCTKSFTATLVARLVDAGKFSFDLTVAQVFPELSPSAKSTYGSITVAQLLGHRSGLSDIAILPTSLTDLPQGFPSLKGSPAAVRARFVPYVFSSAPSSTPGTDWEYSNIGYAMVAAMLERKLKTSYESLMSNWVFKPLGLSSARVAYPTTVTGHQPDGTPNPPSQRDPMALAPAGFISINISDWAKYLAIHLGQQVKGKDFLKPATLQRLHTPLPGTVPDAVGSGYALGWATLDNNGQTLLTHDGDDARSFVANCLLNPNNKSAVLLLINQTGNKADTLLGSATQSLAQQYLS
jgi:CubicO group peptidase (beta-lactamase class C family)